MSARAFYGIPKAFARGMRFQRVNVPKMAQRMWRNDEGFYQTLKELNRPNILSTKSMRSLTNRLRAVEMKRIQIGALYAFSYVSKEFLDLLAHFEELLSEENTEDDKKKTTLTGLQQY